MELAGKMLIAMPGLGDARFSRSVIMVCAHTSDAAMGLIVNKPTPELTFAGLLDHVGIAPVTTPRDIRVHFGGPVDRGRGFVLHSPDWTDGQATMEVPGGFRMTATVDILEAMAAGHGPQRALLALGYAGWGAGQLEAEIQRNDWLVADPPADLVFGDEDRGKWLGALKALGICPLSLSLTAGHA